MRIRFLLALVGLAISFALPSFAQQTNSPDPELREALTTFNKKVDDGLNSGDAAALAALFTEDAVFVTDQGPIFRSAGYREMVCRSVPDDSFQQPFRYGRSKFPS